MFTQTLERYGADLAHLRRFDHEDDPNQLVYATILAAIRDQDGDLAPLVGVYEWQGAPLAAVVDGTKLTDDDHLRRLRRLVAMRGDIPYLAVVSAGRVIFHQTGLDKAKLVASLIDAGSSPCSFATLANLRPKAARPGAYISDVILKLLTGTIDELKAANVGDEDAISLAGRALFTRFLADRGLIPSEMLTGGVDGANLFDDPTSAQSTCAWLDRTFNGDLLPLGDNLFGRLLPGVFAALGDVMRRADGRQYRLGWETRWDYLDFSHIPVGVLSQAYEMYMRKHQSAKQRKEGSFYTPRPLAELMVRAAFAGLPAERRGCADILDPAAGAGVFLLVAFRHLVQEHWRQTGLRPDTETLRQLLYANIRGFDVNEGALRFAALGLYLLSIELDPNPQPVDKLRFAHNLRGLVLHKVGDGERSLGSLGDNVDPAHLGRYDLVVGNPPWPTGTKLSQWHQVTTCVARIARQRLGEAVHAPIPNEALDLPFVWRAMEWARPGGQIAFALHGRLLFQQGDGMPEARSALFSALDVTAVVNGADLRNTKVWPGISAPFCLLFARNVMPAPGAGFRFLSPRCEPELNNAGVLRLDTINSAIVGPEQLISRPTILKTLYRGGTLDLEVLDRLRDQGLVPLREYWGGLFGWEKKRPKCTGSGYQALRDSSRFRKAGDGEKGEPAGDLDALPEFVGQDGSGVAVKAQSLSRFLLGRVHHRRAIEIYQAPLMLVHKAPPTEKGRIGIFVADKCVRYDSSYYGYSGCNHADAEKLIQYLALVVSSRLALWQVLLLSGEFGFERDTVEKLTIDSLLILPFDQLTSEQRDDIGRLFTKVSADPSPADWSEVDKWVGELYGLHPRDLRVIEDTLAYNLPFSANREAARIQADDGEVLAFCQELARELDVWGQDVAVTPVKTPASSPWRVVRVLFGKGDLPPDDLELQLLALADSLAATEVAIPLADQRGLFLARLGQARYWSVSQARLAARTIVWEHDGLLDGIELGGFEADGGKLE
jgi:hypothetical protein